MRLTPQNRGLTNRGTPTRRERRIAAVRKAERNGGKVKAKDIAEARGR